MVNIGVIKVAGENQRKKLKSEIYREKKISENKKTPSFKDKEGGL